MKKTIALLLILSAGILFTACKDSKKDKDIKTETGKDEMPDMKKLVDDHPGLNAGTGTFSISAPEGWTQKDTSISGAKLTTISSPSDGSMDKFRENVNVTTENAHGYDLSAYVDANRSTMEKQISSINFVDQGDAKIGDQPAKWIVYGFNYSGYDLKNTAYFVVKNDIGYVITCTALKSTFDRFQTGFKTCVNSFKVN